MYIYDNISPNSSWNEEPYRIKAEEKIKTRILCSTLFFRKPCLFWGDVVKKMVESRKGHRWQYIRRKRFSCLTTTARLQTHTQDFPRQQRLRERASILRYTHTACIVSFCFIRMWNLVSSSEWQSQTGSDNREQRGFRSIELSDLWTGYRKLNYSLQSDTMMRLEALNPFPSSNSSQWFSRTIRSVCPFSAYCYFTCSVWSGHLFMDNRWYSRSVLKKRDISAKATF